MSCVELSPLFNPLKVTAADCVVFCDWKVMLLQFVNANTQGLSPKVRKSSVKMEKVNFF